MPERALSSRHPGKADMHDVGLNFSKLTGKGTHHVSSWMISIYLISGATNSGVSDKT